MQNKFIKTIQIIHIAMFAGMSIFLGIIYNINKDSWQFTFPDKGIFQWIAIIVVLFSLYISSFLFKKTIKKIDNKIPLFNKLMIYQKALIIKFAPIEMVSILCIVGAFITKNLLYLIVATFLIVYFFTLRPSIEKLFSDLNLTLQEKQEFERGIF